MESLNSADSVTETLSVADEVTRGRAKQNKSEITSSVKLVKTGEFFSFKECESIK